MGCWSVLVWGRSRQDPITLMVILHCQTVHLYSNTFPMFDSPLTQSQAQLLPCHDPSVVLTSVESFGGMAHDLVRSDIIWCPTLITNEDFRKNSPINCSAKYLSFRYHSCRAPPLVAHSASLSGSTDAETISTSTQSASFKIESIIP